jgi:alpha-beta hydrolase superfamily lysophospholipase
MLRAITFSGYNSHYPKSEGPNAWLTRDLSIINEYDGHPYSGFIFTVSAYRDLFRFLARSNSKSWFQSYPKGMPTLIMSGTEDPVGGYGKGVATVYKNLLLRLKRSRLFSIWIFQLWFYLDFLLSKRYTAVPTRIIIIIKIMKIINQKLVIL